jgi:RNA polymerase sigma factor (TIGR02999 family)
MVDIREILESVKRTGTPVSAEMLPLVYDELRNLAAGYMAREVSGQTLQPTALVHEAWLRLTKEDARLWSDRAHFFRAAAQAMRHILVDRARAKASLKRGANAKALDVYDLDLAEATMDERVLLVDEMLDRLERENPQGARVISLKFFGGLTEKEITAMHGVTERTVRRQWAYARTRLFQMLREEAATKKPQ